jgi:LPS-assembly lipoprotein
MSKGAGGFCRRFLGRFLGVVALSLALAGCLRPRYGPVATTGPDVATELRAIAVDPIPDRLGHYLGNELHFALNGTGSNVSPRYRLIVTVHQWVQTPLIDTVSGRPSAGNLMVKAFYQLTPTGGGAPITQGTTTVVAGYDRTSIRYANLRAARDAEIRDARVLAEQIRTRLASAFVERSNQTPAPVSEATAASNSTKPSGN